jgi:signal peptidase
MAAVAIIAIAALILVPRAMGWEGMVVLSGSMEPALPTGGLAFMQPLDDAARERIQPGDIITFRNPRFDSLTSHRVVEVARDQEGLYFITKGDANTVEDAAPVRASRVIGKVRFDVPELGNVVRRLQDRSTYYLVLGIPAGLLIAGEAWNIVKELRRNGRNYRAGRAGQEVGS